MFRVSKRTDLMRNCTLTTRIITTVNHLIQNYPGIKLWNMSVETIDLIAGNYPIVRRVFHRKRQIALRNSSVLWATWSASGHNPEPSSLPSSSDPQLLNYNCHKFAIVKTHRHRFDIDLVVNSKLLSRLRCSFYQFASRSGRI